MWSWFIFQQDYLQSNERIYIKLLPEVCLGPWHNRMIRITIRICNRIAQKIFF